MTFSVGSETEESMDSGRTTSGEERQSRPCSRTENATAFVNSEGLLDLSNIGLTALSADFQHEYSITKELDISKNNLKTCNLSPFTVCRKVNISQNNFSSLSSLTNCSRKLDTIIACDNEIRINNKLQDFRTLSSLHLCRNSLKAFPCLKLNNLRFLDLTDNAISEFPDLTYLPSLDTFLLANNQITSLKHSTQGKCNLKVLDLSGNPISNLCEIYHLEKMKDITNISLKNTPCLTAFEEYHYRSFLIVLFPSILFINNVDVFEIESFNAEFLTLRGNLTGLHSKFSSSSGDNESLASYLREQSVQTDTSGRMPKDDKLYKMMLARSQSHTTPYEEKRAMSASTSKYSQTQREVKGNRRKSFAACKTSLKLSDNDGSEFMQTDDDLSVHSPFGNFIAQLGKENHCPRTKEKRKNVDECSPSSYGAEKSVYHPVSDGSISADVPAMSSDTQRSPQYNSSEYQSSGRTSVGTLTPTLKYSTPPAQHKARVLDATFTKEEREELNQVKAVLDDLYESNGKLYMVQDIISETMKQMECLNKERTTELHERNCVLEEQCKNLEERIAFLELRHKGPTPVIQRVVRKDSESEIGLNWHASFVKGYNLILDGCVIGTVKGTSAKVTDVGSGDHTLRVQTVLFDGSLGETSEEVLVSNSEEDV